MYGDIDKMASFFEIKIKYKILIFMTLLVAITSISFSVIYLKSQKEALLTNIDSKLVSVARSAEYLLPENYHDNIIDRNSVSKEDYLKIIDRYNRLCLKLGLEYIWSLMLIDDQIVFTSSTSTDKKIENGQHALFFDVHSNPDAYKKAFETMEIDHRINDNKWGYTRVVLVPSFDNKGRRYLFGASMKISDVDILVKRTVMNSLIIGVAICLLGGFLSFLLANSLSIPIIKLTKVAERIARGNLDQSIDVRGSFELESLSGSLNYMRKAISDKISELNLKNDELELEIKERKQAEEALRESEERYRSLFKKNHSIMLLIDPENADIVDANSAAISFYGWSYEALIGKKVSEINTLTKEQLFHEMELAKNEHRNHFYFRHRLSNGEIRDVEVYSAPITIHDKKLLYSIIYDITVLKQTEIALRESEEEYRSMMESMKDPIYICSPDYRVEYMNPAMIKRTGRDAVGELCFKALHDLAEKCSWCIHEKKRGEYYELDIVSPKDNRSYHISNSPIARGDGSFSKMTVFRDTTDLKKMETQLQQAQKMEAIGTLAGGIAHDFNNILFPISGYTEMLLLDTPDDSPQHHSLSEILAGAKRAGELVKQILTFSRQRQHELKPLKVEVVVKEALKLIRSSLPTTIEIRQNVNKDCGLVMADPTQIHQIVMNLCTNAYHAMEETGGKLIVNLKGVELETEDLKDPSMISGKYVCLTVADTGPGMEQSIIDRIFDPYFTTKENGKGTGLGLAVVHGIVKSHGGHISVYSEPGKGTEFKVHLPVIKEQKETSKVETDTPIQKGDERILLVDDQDIIVQIEKQMLERLGYRVTARTSSIDALEAFRMEPDKFDLVITDLTMPNMTGDKLAVELIKIRSEIPVILCTGFSEMMSKEKAQSLGIEGFLMKPVVLKDLSGMIRKVLDKK